MLFRKFEGERARETENERKWKKNWNIKNVYVEKTRVRDACDDEKD